MQRLQVELVGRLRRYKLHGWALHRLGDRLRITKVVLLPLRIGPHILRRHQPGIMTKRLELATEVMRTNAGFHANQARRHVGQPRLNLAARPLLAQHDGAAIIQPYKVKRVFADIDADYGHCIADIV